MEGNQIAIRLRKKRIVELGNNFNYRVLDDIRIRMEELARESSEDIAFVINSSGGDMPCTHRFFDQMKFMLNFPVTGIVVGTCWSAAVSILQTCRARYAFPCSDFFLHYSKNTVEYDLILSDAVIREKFERSLIESRRHQAESEEIIVARTSKTIEQVQQAMRDGNILDKHMSSQEALDFGLIDKIITEPELWEN